MLTQKKLWSKRCHESNHATHQRQNRYGEKKGLTETLLKKQNKNKNLHQDPQQDHQLDSRKILLEKNTALLKRGERRERNYKTKAKAVLN